MSKLSNVCSICTDDFKNSDDIYSTSCGHIFHYVCISSWKSRSTSCPLCIQFNPTIYKLFLTFEENEPEDPDKIKELELKLKTLNEKNEQLVDDKQEIEFNFLQLQEQFTLIEQEKKNLEERIRQMKDSDENFLHLQGQYTESSEFINHLQNEIKELLKTKCTNEELLKKTSSLENELRKLLIANKMQTKEIRLKCLEIESLKTDLESRQSTESEHIEYGKTKNLEQQLKYITIELEKQIVNNTKITIENLKLQSIVDHLNTGKTETPSFLNETIKNSKMHKNHNKENVKNSVKTSSHNLRNNTSTKIIIRELPLEQLTAPLINIIVNMASKIKVDLCPDDVVQVKLVDNNKQMSSKVQLMVEFKNIELKHKFMSNKNILKNDPSTNSIIIGDYIDDEIYSLLMYAKKMLRNNGYNHVFCKNNQIYAKKHRTHPKVVHILDKAHVHTLRNNTQSLELEIKDSIEITEGTVDENYYQL